LRMIISYAQNLDFGGRRLLVHGSLPQLSLHGIFSKIIGCEPSLDKSAFRQLAGGEFSVSENPVSQALSCPVGGLLAVCPSYDQKSGPGLDAQVVREFACLCSCGEIF
jgi:hypothetical protein